MQNGARYEVEVGAHVDLVQQLHHACRDGDPCRVVAPRACENRQPLRATDSGHEVGDIVTRESEGGAGACKPVSLGVVDVGCLEEVIQLSLVERLEQSDCRFAVVETAHVRYRPVCRWLTSPVVVYEGPAA
jgi:hypothetical protein